MSQEFATLPISSLSVGIVLTSPIFDSDNPNTKLLGKDLEVNQSFLDKLFSRGITSVTISKRDIAAITAGQPQGVRKSCRDHQYQATTLTSEKSAEIEAEIEATELPTELKDLGTAERNLETSTEQYDTEAIAEEIHRREKFIDYTENLFVDLIGGKGTDTAQLSSICSSSIKSVVDDKDLFLCLGINPFDSQYPSRHSLHVSSVAISIGVMLGLDDQSLEDLGTGCLIHDVGMLKLDQNLFRAERTLKTDELSKLSEHPILTMDALACPGVKLTRIARIVAYQIHERCNGSGYPRGATGDDMHFLSKIAAVADAYVGLVSNRWHRKALVPYYAMEKILNSIPAGLFDGKVVRGLLHAVSLFPIGSYVQLTDGRVAKVARSTGASYTTPLIQLWNQKHNQFETELVDLRQETKFAISRPIARLA